MVVTVNIYDNNVYQTKIEELKAGWHSKCDGPDAIMVVIHDYIVTPEI